AVPSRLPSVRAASVTISTPRSGAPIAWAAAPDDAPRASRRNRTGHSSCWLSRFRASPNLAFKRIVRLHAVKTEPSVPAGGTARGLTTLAGGKVLCLRASVVIVIVLRL